MNSSAASFKTVAFVRSAILPGHEPAPAEVITWARGSTTLPAAPHWFGSANDRPVEILSLLGQHGERIHGDIHPQGHKAHEAKQAGGG